MGRVLTDLEAMGIPVSSTGPMPENLISLSSAGVDLRGRVAESPCTPFTRVPVMQRGGTHDSSIYYCQPGTRDRDSHTEIRIRKILTM